MIVCFDLDDTLYDEIEYVQSGLKAVAIYLNTSKLLDYSADDMYFQLTKILHENGRGNVFDIFLAMNGKYSKKMVKKCLSIYRNHVPEISLSEEALTTLELLVKKYDKLYLITDGNLTVQRNKIRALGVAKYFKKTIPTHQYGLSHSKPSLSVFMKIAKWENVDLSELVYIGDNPNKDFVALNQNGSLTIRIMNGMFKNIELAWPFEARHRINKLSEVYQILDNYE